MSSILRSKLASLQSITTDSSQFLEALDAVAIFQATHQQNDANSKMRKKSKTNLTLRVQLRTSTRR